MARDKVLEVNLTVARGFWLQCPLFYALNSVDMLGI